ncbi:MAG: S8 family serine peptidase, partial [Acidobacteriota bacterium]
MTALRGMNLHKLRIPGSSAESSAHQFAAQFPVEYVEPDRIRQVSAAAPNDTYYASQWALQTVQALQAWGAMPNAYLTSAGAGAGRIKVAVLDTGIDCTHPDFANAGGSSTDSAQGGQLLFGAGRAFVATSLSSPACSWQDDHGHGTHVAGTVAAATNNSRGVSALGYSLQVIGMKVLDRSGSGTDSDVADAIMAAADAGAQIISMSLGGAGYSQALQDAIRYAWQRNSLVVAAAGNAGSST